MKMALVAAMMVLAAGRVSPQEKSAYSGIVEGRVTRPGGKEGIAETQVILLAAQADSPDAEPLLAAVTLTDSDGRFSFKKLAPGSYTVRVEREGYFGVPPRGSAGLEAPTSLSASVTIIPGHTPADLSFNLVHGGVISGHLRDPIGKLLTNFTISAYETAYRDGRAVLIPVKSTQTDDRGEYRLYWLAPGNYLVGVNPRRPGAVPNPSDAYARTFYPGLIDARIVPPVIVTDGSEIPSVDILVRADATAKVSGRVVAVAEGAGEPLPAASSQLMLVSRDPNAVLVSGETGGLNATVNRSSGRFEIRNVLPGSYDLIATAPEAASRGFSGRTRIDVGGVNLDDVTVEVRSGVELRARLRIDGQESAPASAPVALVGADAAPPAPPKPAIALSLQSIGAYTGFDRAANTSVTVDPAGVFVFPGVPEGRYRFQAEGLPASAYIEDVREGTISVFDEGLLVTGRPAGEIFVVINTKGATVRGKVTDSAQDLFKGALVALVPSLSRRQNLTLYRTTTSDEFGAFTISGVAPGEYRVFAWESVPENAWLSSDFMALQEARGKPVVVGAVGLDDVSLKVIPREASSR